MTFYRFEKVKSFTKNEREIIVFVKTDLGRMMKKETFSEVELIDRCLVEMHLTLSKRILILDQYRMTFMV